MITDDFGCIVTRNVDELGRKIEEVVVKRKCSSFSQQASRQYYEQYFTLRSMIVKYSQTLY